MRNLDEILALTAAVEQHLDRGEWVEAAALDIERRRLLGEWFADPAAITDPAACHEVLRGILLRNNQAIGQLQAERQRLQAAAALSNRAMRAYDHNTTGSNIAWLRPAEAAPP